MGVGSGRSKVADLAFSVFGRVVHPDWFAVRGHRRIARIGWEADIRLIEGGHAISWAAGAARVTEVLRGPETPMPDLGVLFESTVRRERTARLQPHPTVEYCTCFDVERLDRQVFARLTEEMLADSTRGDLVRQFPTAGRMDPQAVSRVHIEARAKGLSIQGYHTFPGELAIVRTQSLFEILG